MSGSKLDQIVKGAAPPGTSVPSITSRSPSPAPLSDEAAARTSAATGSHTSDPLASLPSSPPQIYLNLLILEASLRSQYLTLRARRRQNTFFLLLLIIWVAYFFYALFLHPREDGSGIGGSVYWVVEMTEKVALMGGVVTGILVWGTGQWERGVRWPRRYVGVTNRGLRTMNCKIVVLKGRWWKEIFDHLAFLFPYSSFFAAQGSSYHYVDASLERESHHIAKQGHEDWIREEDLAPGGDHIKLLLLPKPFSPDFRENWELYRSEYWEKENERRAILLQRLRQQARQRAREQGKWLWWTGWRGWRRPIRPMSREDDLEKTHPRHFTEKDAKQRLSVRRSESHSRNSSRSSTPSNLDMEERPTAWRSRRGSSSSSINEGRKRSKVGSSLRDSQMTPLTAPDASRLSVLVPAAKHHAPAAASNLGTSSGNESDRSTEDVQATRRSKRITK